MPWKMPLPGGGTMSFEKQNGLSGILKKFQDGSTNLYQTLRNVQTLYGGLRLDGEEIELSCLFCGKEITPFVDFIVVAEPASDFLSGKEITPFVDEVASIHFDPGTPDTRVTPGEPASVFLVCEECMEEAFNDG
jgi:hypothetical protein